MRCNVAEMKRDVNAECPDCYIGSRIRGLRLSLGLTQSDLADMIGSRYNQLHKIETGKDRISASQLYLVACALGVAVDYFFDGQTFKMETEDIRRMRSFRHHLNHITDLADLEVIGQMIAVVKETGRPV